MTEQTDKIVALVDGSDYAASLCNHAAWIAQRTGAAVELVHILDQRNAPQTRDLSGTIALGARSALLNELAELDAQRAKLITQRGRAILDDARSLLEKAGVSAISTRLLQGDIVELLQDIETEARVIMIGKRGEGADFAKGHLGSNLERIVRACTKPVFVASRAFKPIERVLLAYDGGASSRKVVDHIARSPLFRGLHLHLVTVGRPNDAPERGLEDAKACLSAAGLAVEASLLPGQPDTALRKLADDGEADMLVMGAYGHSRLRQMIIGSTTNEMIRACRLPVVLLR